MPRPRSSTKVLCRTEAGLIAEPAKVRRDVTNFAAPCPQLGSPARGCRPTWRPRPSPRAHALAAPASASLPHPRIRQGVRHLWVLKRGREGVQLPPPFQTCRGFSRHHEAGLCPEAAAALATVASKTHSGFQSQRHCSLDSLPLSPQAPRQSTPSLHSQRHPQVGGRQHQARVISSHDPEERRKQNSPTSRGHEPRAQHLTGLLGLPEVPACSPLRPGLVSCFLHTHSTPLLPTAPTGLSLGAASSRKPSLITTGWGEMPLLPLSQLPTPTHAAAPATLGGKNPSVGLSPSAGRELHGAGRGPGRLAAVSGAASSSRPAAEQR